VLNLLQMYFERSDPVNFARRLFREPVAGAQRRHVLHVYGTADTYAPNETQRRYAQAAAFQVALPLVDEYPTLPEYGMVTVAPPISANQAFATLAPITAAQAAIPARWLRRALRFHDECQRAHGHSEDASHPGPRAESDHRSVACGTPSPKLLR